MFDRVLNRPLKKVLFLMYLLRKKWQVIFTTLLKLLLHPQFFQLEIYLVYLKPLNTLTKSFISHHFAIASAPPCSFFVLFCFCVCPSSIIFYLWHKLSASLTALITLRYYFLSFQHTCYLPPFIFSISALIIGIFYCLDCTSLLLTPYCWHLFTPSWFTVEISIIWPNDTYFNCQSK